MDRLTSGDVLAMSWSLVFFLELRSGVMIVVSYASVLWRQIDAAFRDGVVKGVDGGREVR